MKVVMNCGHNHTGRLLMELALIVTAIDGLSDDIPSICLYQWYGHQTTDTL
jgi:hypothetical protein